MSEQRRVWATHPDDEETGERLPAVVIGGPRLHQASPSTARNPAPAISVVTVRFDDGRTTSVTEESLVDA